MIAKRIPRDRATSNMARLVRYVVDAQGREDPRSWTNTAEYILATRSNGEKVGGVRVTNCHSDEPVAATLEILATQALNTRSKADKTYHLVFSFPPGEQPPLAVLHAIEDELCAAIGMADHQRISAVHVDTDHLHVHVAINKVHPQTYRNFEPYYDHKRLMAACDRLEIKHGLQPTNHGREQLHNKRHQQQQERTNERYRNRDRARGRGQLPSASDDRRGELAGLRESDIAFDPRRDPPGQIHGLPNVSSLRMVRVTRSGHVLLQNNARHDVHTGKPTGPEVLRRQGNGIGREAGEDAERKVKPSARVAAMEAYTGEESMQTWVRKHALADLLVANSWDDAHRVLEQLGLVLKQRGAGLAIYDPVAQIGIRASSVDRALSWAALNARFGAFHDANPIKPVATPGAHRAMPPKDYTDKQGMQEWLRKHLPAAARAVSSWDQLHRILGELGLQRINSTTILDPASGLRIRGDDVDASISFERLKNRLGGFKRAQPDDSVGGGESHAHEPASGYTRGSREEAGGYTRGPRETASNTSALYAEYQRSRIASQNQREKSLASVRADGAAKFDHAKAVYAFKRKALKLIAGIPRHAKKLSYQALRMEYQANISAIRAQQAKARKDVLQAHAAPSWDDFIRQRAATGDQDALALMRARANRLMRAHNDLLTAPNAEAARAVVFKHLKPRVARSGEIHYRTADGGLVVDRGVEVRSAKSTATAAFIALSLATTKFPGQSLIVEGTEEFRLQVAELAGAKGVQVRFADPVMDAHRQQAAKTREAKASTRPGPSPEAASQQSKGQANGQATPGAGVKREWQGERPVDLADAPNAPNRDGSRTSSATDSPSPAVMKWVEERNDTARRVSDINYTRLWEPADAGEVTYQGRRRMEDGSEVVLLGRQGQTLVKPVTAAVAAKASRFKIGQAVVLDERGRFVDTSRGRRR